TIANPNIRQLFSQQSFHHFDLFSDYLPRLAHLFQREATGELGRSHGLQDVQKYMTRMEAIDFTLQHDDGLQTKNYEDADVILLGVSRSGKTPTC
ncbi:kinase/pyrophosphorylase, partial [Acinetobacter baumannii]